MNTRFDESYFHAHTYAGVSFARYSQYWWSNRFYAMLARRYGRKGCRLLEIGSGMGHLVGQLEGRFATFAVDLNQWALHESLKVAPYTLHALSSAQELPFSKQTFGAVIIKHVLEHLSDARKAIQEIGRVTAADGILILSTPNMESLLKPCKGKEWIGFQDPTHISLKPPREWMELVEAAGFEIRRIFADGFWDTPYVGVVPEVLQKLIFGAPGGFQALSGLVFLPYRWGESIMMIARKL